MALIALLDNFNGANLMVSPRRLASGLGVNAENMRLGFAELRPLNGPATVVTTGGATPLLSAYRMGTTPSDTASWLQWTSDVDVARSLIANDSTEEIYVTGDGAPKATDNVIGLPATPGPASYRTLGIPKPSAAMSAPTVLVAGSAPNESRVYVDTFVNDKGRESAPGTEVSVTVAGGSTMTLPSLVPAPGGSHGITLRRIYCSTDGGDYLRVVEQSASLTSATDNLARGAVLQSGGDQSKPAWLEPPSGLVGIINLWNQMIGGFYGKSYCVCVPGKPWAWPVEYQDVIPHDIVGTGRWLENWLLLTKGGPYIVRGASPDGMANKPVSALMQSCEAKRSIVSMESGVAWAGPRGLCFVGEGGAYIVTDGILSPEQWQAMAPSTMVGAQWERYYVGFYNDGTPKAFMVDPRDPKGGIVFLSFGARGAYRDALSDRLYLLDTGNTIKRFGAGSALAATFKSGIARSAGLTNAGFGLVVANEPISAAVTVWANVLQAGGAFAWTQVFSRTVQSGQPFAMPGGYLAQEFQAQIQTSGAVQALMLAEDVDDLG